MSYDICSARHCSVCMVLETQDTPANRYREYNPDAEKATTNGTAKRPTLRKCNGCQLVVYCSTEHQKIDWVMHRDLCRATQTLLATYNVEHPYLLDGQPKTAADMERAILQVKYVLRGALARPLHFHEEEVTSYPRNCQLCYSLRSPHACEHCHGVSYCSAEHAAADAPRHKRFCGLLQLYYSPYKAMGMEPVEFEFYRRVPDLHKLDLFEAFSRATLKRLPAKPTESLRSYRLFATAADFSCIGTICYALSFTEMRCYDNEKFVIFIVGATFEQQLWFQTMHTKFFFLQHPQISVLCLFFIGPEVEGDDDRLEEYVYQGQERSVQYITYRGLFQDFSTERNIKPSIIISYNCGFSEHVSDYEELKEMLSTETNTLESYTDMAANCNGLSTSNKLDTWSMGILQMLLTFDVPIVFTSFTAQEANFDFATVQRIACAVKESMIVSRIFNVKQNPFRDLRPLRSWRVSENDEIFYRNGYVQALRIL